MARCDWSFDKSDIYRFSCEKQSLFVDFEGGLTFKRRQAEIDEIFEAKRKDIDDFLKHKDALRARITKDIEEKYQIDVSEIDDILKETRDEAKSMIKAELESQLLEEEKVNKSIPVYFYSLGAKSNW